jgi:hypothetical protein
MKFRSILTFSPSTLLKTGLLAVLLLVGCAPAAAPESAQPEAPAQTAAPATVEPPTPSPLPPTETTAPIVPTEAAPTEAPQVIATSRGPNLEATDPSTYTRASGELQLVEFFAFW